MNKNLLNINVCLRCLAMIAGILSVRETGTAQINYHLTTKPTPIRFEKHVISFLDKTEEYVSEGVAVGDVNKDGMMDIMSGTFWWEAPKWVKHEITVPEIHSIGGYGNHFLDFSMDVNQDGWIDLIGIGFPGKEAYWYENPKNANGHWKRHLVFPSVGNESPGLYDVNGDGRMDLVCADPANKRVVWVSPPDGKGDTAWTTHVISRDTLRGTHHFTHGLGFGDINGDGRKDIIIREGWWEAPVDRNQADWVFHPAALGDECSQMYVLDLDKDGDSDVISASAHNYGIWWYEQVKDNNNVTWKKHDIFREFSQSHGMALLDVNKDGYPDLITGKRFWAHQGGDPGEREPAVIYWFEIKPGKVPEFIPHLIDDNSGVGLQVVTSDMNKDKLEDIIIGNKKGIFLFLQVGSPSNNK